MSTQFNELKNAIYEGDLDKVTKLIVSLTKDTDNVIIQPKPQFMTAKVSSTEIEINLI